jgi:hypothetical protein
MNERVLFVDLENVQKVDLKQVPVSARVMIFYGITQKKLPEELVVQAQPLGSRLKWESGPIRVLDWELLRSSTPSARVSG